MNTNQLNQQYAISGHIDFKEENGLIVAKVANGLASATISLYGAHVQSYQPNGQKEVLWMSPQSAFEVGTPIRGGIPICFPWFGPNPEDSSKPAHGFARLSTWEVVKTAALPTGDTEIVFELRNSSYTEGLWPFSFVASLTVVVGKRLEVTLCYTNTGSSQPFTVSDALHSYFSVSDAGKVGIEGLSGYRYYDGFEKEPTHTQSEAILAVEREENRRYIGHSAACTIADAAWNRRIRVEKQGSEVTVVWNPWEATTKTIGDIPDEGYRSFVCVEAVNAYSNSVVLQPGQSHSITTTIGIV
jgi:glucose-6-phosphate 1-epimerase